MLVAELVWLWWAARHGGLRAQPAEPAAGTPRPATASRLAGRARFRHR
jgi:hypothetical protein